MQRYSEKREAILHCLRQTTAHPTAEQIFAALKPQYPDLSLGTVYRNLTALKAAGVIRSVGIVDGQERFDGTVAPHPHAVCRKCGRVLDLTGVTVPTASAAQKEIGDGFLAEDVTVQVYGLCARCREEER